MDMPTSSNKRPVVPLIAVAGVFTLLISLLPYYGYRVVANEFDQWVFLVFLGAWGLTGVLAILVRGYCVGDASATGAGGKHHDAGVHGASVCERGRRVRRGPGGVC